MSSPGSLRAFGPLLGLLVWLRTCELPVAGITNPDGFGPHTNQSQELVLRLVKTATVKVPVTHISASTWDCDEAPVIQRRLKVLKSEPPMGHGLWEPVAIPADYVSTNAPSPVVLHASRIKY